MEEFHVKQAPYRAVRGPVMRTALHKVIVPDLEQMPSGKASTGTLVKTHTLINPRNCCSVGKSASSARKIEGREENGAH